MRVACATIVLCWFLVSTAALAAVENVYQSATTGCAKNVCFKITAPQMGRSFVSTKYYVARHLTLELFDRKSQRSLKRWTAPQALFNWKDDRWVLSAAVSSQGGRPKDMYFYPETGLVEFVFARR